MDAWIPASTVFLLERREGKKLRAATFVSARLMDEDEIRSVPAPAAAADFGPQAGDLELQCLNPGTQTGDLVEQAPVGR
jgi:hypothetical protein